MRGAQRTEMPVHGRIRKADADVSEGERQEHGGRCVEDDMLKVLQGQYEG